MRKVRTILQVHTLGCDAYMTEGSGGLGEDKGRLVFFKFYFSLRRFKFVTETQSIKQKSVLGHALVLVYKSL